MSSSSALVGPTKLLLDDDITTIVAHWNLMHGIADFIILAGQIMWISAESVQHTVPKVHTKRSPSKKNNNAA